MQEDATNVITRFQERLDMYSDVNFHGSYLGPKSATSTCVESLKHVNAHFTQMKRDRKRNKDMIDACEEMLAALEDYEAKQSVLDQSLLNIDRLEEKIGIEQSNLMRQLLKTNSRSDNVVSRVRSNIIFRKEAHAKHNFHISEEYIQLKRAICDELEMSEEITSEMNKGILTCSICYDHKITECLNPCGHTFCGGCSTKIAKQCFICKKEVKSKTKMYIVGDDDDKPVVASNHFVDVYAMVDSMHGADIYGFGQ